MVIVNFVYCFAYDYEPLRIYDFLLRKDLVYIAFFFQNLHMFLLSFAYFPRVLMFLDYFADILFFFHRLMKIELIVAFMI